MLIEIPYTDSKTQKAFLAGVIFAFGVQYGLSHKLTFDKEGWNTGKLSGNHFFVKGGVPTKGNPHVLKAAREHKTKLTQIQKHVSNRPVQMPSSESVKLDPQRQLHPGSELTSRLIGEYAQELKNSSGNSTAAVTQFFNKHLKNKQQVIAVNGRRAIVEYNNATFNELRKYCNNPRKAELIPYIPEILDTTKGVAVNSYKPHEKEKIEDFVTYKKIINNKTVYVDIGIRYRDPALIVYNLTTEGVPGFKRKNKKISNILDK